MIIESGILNYKLLITLLYPISYQISFYVTQKKTPPLYDCFINSISYLLAGLIYLIILHRSNIIKKSTTLKNFEGKLVAVNQVYIENQRNIKKRKIKEIFSIFLLSFIFTIPIFIESYVEKKIYLKLTFSLGIVSYIIFNVFFSYLFLNSKLYKHQIISLIIIIFCLIICLFIDIIQIMKETVDFDIFLVSILYLIVTFGLYSLYDILIKLHLETYSGDPYQLMFYIGFFSLILITIIDLFYYFFKIYIFGKDVINEINDNFSFRYILLIIFDILVGFLWQSGIFLTIYYFTPCHLIISEIFCEYFAKLIAWIIKKLIDVWYIKMIYSFLYFIMLISSLIYNEVIIIKFCSMEENTYKYIALRQKIEFEDIQYTLELHENNREKEERELISEL